MKLTCCLVSLLLATLAVVAHGCGEYCEDWTLCQRVRCAPTPDPCPANTPYLLYGECGCCTFCSDSPRVGPCGTCGSCLEEYPQCQEGQITSIDYCGCCRECKSVLGLGEECACTGPSFPVCAAGLQCLNGTCVEQT